MQHVACRPSNTGLGALQRQMDRFFQDLTPRRPAWGPHLDISETADEIRVEAEIPGIDPSTVDISLEDKTLTIRGEKTVEKEEEGRAWRHVERRQGSFSRIITLSAPVESEQIEAVAKDGVLTLTLPKRQEARPQKIEIRAE